MESLQNLFNLDVPNEVDAVTQALKRRLTPHSTADMADSLWANLKMSEFAYEEPLP